MTEIDALYTYAIIGGLVITAVYYGLRLRIEAHKEQSSRASLEAMVKYHSQRLDIEEEKLELARGNAPSSQGVHVKEHSRKPKSRDISFSELESIQKDMVKRYPSLGNADNSVEPTATMGTGKPVMMSDEEFAARIKKIREMGQ